MVQDKNIVLGVTGSIAVYKAVEVASKLIQEGAKVNVVMTQAAQEFVAPLTFRAITNRPVVMEMFNPASEFSIEHVTLAAGADLVVIAPATANVIAKLAGGIADDMLSCTVLATKVPIIVAPAMDANMYQNQISQQNIAKLKGRGFTFVGPGYGRLASGEVGSGRLADIEEIIGTIHQVLGRRGDLAKRRIVVSAGGTQEPVDPVRHIGNRSSGKMGYAIAEAARDRGASVVLVSGPTALHPPVGVEVIQVQTAVEMRDAIVDATKKAEALLMAAAVSDYRPAAAAKSKIKKERETLSIELVRTPDILGEVKGDFVRVGFAAESEDVVENARVKLKGKNLDLIVANDITAVDSGFGVDTNRVIIIDRQGKVERLPLLSKLEVAHKVLDRVVKLLPRKRQNKRT
ncbi:MAG: bifunctional phosphopantothenoylcysteine decarboxylase/phosphopantothenate--cysteine ligase CoaBC [Dehalococcoidia bacterium]|jgi:phosphopantothenoylcysteine decarboxylase/phosphopantothenate--cysteine ligase|nr:bifunctional phosphopantothenoylcysteine decarboxylase/phosphopantothenate--cysteine ligase CoaBC [Chloroflexota bacterium]MCK4242011.1 bifunctional phosphopantothenoylcysteine decarboxylase/phosphopantothenate--cysteine ligase CoaBC [Dehalococcoidia bacterium]